MTEFDTDPPPRGFRATGTPLLYPGNSFNPPRSVGPAMVRGLKCRCPACGVGRLFPRFLKLTPFCAHCGEPLHHARPDDAPPYFVMLITGHVMVAIGLEMEQTFAPPLWMTGICLSLAAIGLSLALLPPIKGVIVAIQWANWMHGFDSRDREEAFDTIVQTAAGAEPLVTGDRSAPTLEKRLVVRTPLDVS